jgi:hypothetical protein
MASFLSENILDHINKFFLLIHSSNKFTRKSVLSLLLGIKRLISHMTNDSYIRDISKGKVVFMLVVFSMLLTVSMNLNKWNANATIMSDIQGADDIGQSLECVIVVVGCEGTGSVGSSGDTIIGSFNGNDDGSVPNSNNNTNGGDESATLFVAKTVRCQSISGNPSNDAVCNYAINQSPNFPDASDYPITVTGNNPDPSNFPGSTPPVEVSIEAGDYSVSEVLFSTASLQRELGATSIVTSATFTGDCIEDDPFSQSAEGTIAAGESQTCNIDNLIIINGGTVPSAG